MIYIDGGSNTYGDELSDRTSQAWPFLLEKKLQVPVNNVAIKGKSNQHIVYDLVNYCSHSRPNLVIIGWVYTSRKMFIRRETNFLVDITAASSNSIFHSNKEMQQFQQLLFKYWSNYLHDMWNFLHQIILVQKFLDSLSIPYLMFNDSDQNDVLHLLNISSSEVEIKDRLLDAFDNTNDQQILEIEQLINSVYKLIDHENFYDFSWHLRELFEYSGHPSANQHQSILHFLLPMVTTRLS
jgi:hypothetical protein